MTPRDEQTLAALIERALTTKEPDPHVIAMRVVPKLSDEVRQQMIYAGVLDRVCKQISFERSAGPRKPGPSKWATVQRVAPGGEWKLLADCTTDDLLLLAAEYRQRSDELLAREREYRELAGQLRASGCATVGEMWDSPESLAA